MSSRLTTLMLTMGKTMQSLQNSTIVSQKEERKKQERLAAERKAKEEAEAKAAAERKAEDERIAAEKAKKRKKTITLCSIAVVVVIVATIILTTVVIPSSHYSKATDFEASGNYESAIIYYQKAGSYKDSQDKLREVSVLNAKNYEVNDTVYLGKYNGKVLEWTVVSVDSNHAVLVCNQRKAMEMLQIKGGKRDMKAKCNM